MSALLQQTLATANAILDTTKSLALTGQAELLQQEVDAYVTMVDSRAPLVERFLQLKQQLDNGSAAGTYKTMPAYEALRNTIAETVMVDKALRQIVQGIRDTAQSSVKAIRDGRQLMAAYGQPMEEISTGLLDKSQ